MTNEEARTCGCPLDANGNPDPDQKKGRDGKHNRVCDGTGHAMRTGKAAKMGLRYYKCLKCGAVWQATFRAAKILDRGSPQLPQ